MDEYYCSDRAAPYSRGISGSVYYKRSEDCFNIPKDAAPLCKNDNPPRLNISSTTASTLPSLPHKLPINNSVLSTPATPEMRTDQRAHIVEVHEHQISSNKLKETRMHSGLQSHQRMQKQDFGALIKSSIYIFDQAPMNEIGWTSLAAAKMGHAVARFDNSIADLSTGRVNNPNLVDELTRARMELDETRRKLDNLYQHFCSAQDLRQESRPDSKSTSHMTEAIQEKVLDGSYSKATVSNMMQLQPETLITPKSHAVKEFKYMDSFYAANDLQPERNYLSPRADSKSMSHKNEATQEKVIECSRSKASATNSMQLQPKTHINDDARQEYANIAEKNTQSAFPAGYKLNVKTGRISAF